MATQGIPPLSLSSNFGARTREFSEKPTDLWKKWRILEKSGGFEANPAGREFGGETLEDFPYIRRFLNIS